MIRPGSDAPIADLFPPKSDFITSGTDRAGLDALSQLNTLHADARPGDDRLSARVRSYELAAAMQLSATDALDVSSEPQYIKDMYGLAPEGPGVNATGAINEKAESEFFGRKCLVARRLLRIRGRERPCFRFSGFFFDARFALAVGGVSSPAHPGTKKHLVQTSAFLKVYMYMHVCIFVLK